MRSLSCSHTMLSASVVGTPLTWAHIQPSLGMRLDPGKGLQSHFLNARMHLSATCPTRTQMKMAVSSLVLHLPPRMIRGSLTSYSNLVLVFITMAGAGVSCRHFSLAWSLRLPYCTTM